MLWSLPSLETLVNVLLLTVLGLVMLADRLFPARRFPSRPYWRLKGALYFALYLGISLTAPFLWQAEFASWRWIDLTSLAVGFQIAIGFLVYEIVAYAYHRLLHRNDFLWRVHQTHHAAERIDVWSAFMFHPAGTVGWALVGSFALTVIVGLSAEAAVVIQGILTAFAILTHANLKTPHWLGYFVARPEMHAAHHERGVHADNYSDLPLIDMLFGTWRNPEEWQAEVGFADGSSDRIADLILLRDVAGPTEESLDDRRLSVA